MKRLISVILFCLVFLRHGVGHAAVPPEIPASRSYQIYSPFYRVFGESGEAVFTQGSVKNLSYISGIRYIANHVPTAENPVGDLRVFLSMMDTPAGILFLSTHGFPDGLLVEDGYSSIAVATNVIQGYINDNLVTSLEIDYYAFSENEVGIYLKPVFFTQRLTAAHGIVYASACDSYYLWPVFTSFNVVRNYVGFDGNINFYLNDGLTAATKVFNNMAGADTGLGIYANHSIESVIPVAQTAMDDWFRDVIGVGAPTIVLKKGSVLPDAGNMRLYNAPRIVKAEVIQDMDGDGSFENPLHSFNMGDTYPYNPGNTANYPADGNPTSGIGSKGPLKAELRFSEPMNTASAIFNLEASDGTKTPITGSWENETLPGATWKSGIINIPDSFPDGKIIISARAERIFNSGSDFYNKALDLDGDGRSALNEVDRSVDFLRNFHFLPVV